MCSIYMYLEERASFVHSILVLLMVIQNHLKSNLTRTGKKSMGNKVFFTNLFHRVPKETAKKMVFSKKPVECSFIPLSCSSERVAHNWRFIEWRKPLVCFLISLYFNCRNQIKCFNKIDPFWNTKRLILNIYIWKIQNCKYILKQHSNYESEM